MSDASGEPTLPPPDPDGIPTNPPDSGPTLPPPDTPTVLQPAPHAEVLERRELLGQGGMGEVYRVLDRRLGREAALKLVRPDKISPRALMRFRREAELTARLEHPGIPPVYEAGIDGEGRHYLLMKVIRGVPLSKRVQTFHEDYDSLAQGSSELRELLEVVVKVGEALGYAHSQRVVHRDLKPANVMVGRFGEVMVMDWGVARQLDQPRRDEELSDEAAALTDSEAREAGLTQSGAVLGTPGYMPPEQAEGEEVDPRADVFALGCLLACVLTGSTPVLGRTSIQRIVATLRGQIELPSQARPDVPIELNTIVRRALAMDPADRYPDAEALVDDLKAYLRGDEVSTHHYNVLERTKRATSRHPVLLVALLLISLAVGVGVTLNRERARAEAERELAESERAAAKREEQRFREMGKKLERALNLIEDAEELSVWLGPEHDRQIQDKITKALVLVPTRGIRWLAAKVYERSDRRALARQILEESITRYPRPYRELLLLDAIERKDGKSNIAIPRLQALLEQGESGNERVHMALGKWANLEGKLEQALKHYDAAIAIDPELARAFHNRGCVRYELSRKREDTELVHAAIRDFDAALKIHPHWAKAHFNRGLAWLVLNELRKARDDHTQAIKHDPTWWEPRQQRGIMRFLLKDDRGALEDLNRAIALGAGQPDAWRRLYYRGMTRERLGDTQGGRRDLEFSLLFDDADPEVRWKLGHMLLAHKKPAEAKKHLELFLIEAPKHPKAAEVWGLLERANRQLQRE